MATEKADTTDNNCNFRQLSRIYGQMSRIFYQQNLMDLDLQFTDLETKYAWIAKDTLNALLSMTEKIYIYQKKNQVDSAIIMCTKLTELFESYGQKQISSCLPIIFLRDLINRKEISKAKAYMDRYETESGLRLSPSAPDFQALPRAFCAVFRTFVARNNSRRRLQHDVNAPNGIFPRKRSI
jgi:hypothetical protein